MPVHEHVGTQSHMARSHSATRDRIWDMAIECYEYYTVIGTNCSVAMSQTPSLGTELGLFM